MIESTITTLAIRAHSKDLEILCDIKNDVPLNLQGDPVRLRQIMINLIGNAIKFTEKGEIVLYVNLDETYQLSNQLAALHFSVSDTGVGIPADKLEKIFESFSQVDNSTTRKYGGTGLGLTISTKLVEMMDGKIWVESPAQDYRSYIKEHKNYKNKFKNQNFESSIECPGSTFHFTAKFKSGKIISTEIKPYAKNRKLLEALGMSTDLARLNGLPLSKASACSFASPCGDGNLGEAV